MDNKLPVHDSRELETIYERRFDEHITYRNQIWQLLTSKFFSRYISAEDCVLDLGCGYGEFINNIRCGSRYAMDMNPRAKDHLHTGIPFLEQDCSMPWELASDSLDVVFTSNFLEHLPSKSSMKSTLAEAWRCLRKGGRLMAMGPNIRFVGGAYWDFWDHHLALTDTAMAEALSVEGFHVEECVDRFLPYTMVNKRRSPLLLVRLYLDMPVFWRLWGKQFLVVARK